jgi:hypothetical protein
VEDGTVRMTAGPEERPKEERRGGFLRGVRDDASPFGSGAIIFWGIVGVAVGFGLASWMQWQDTPTSFVVIVGGGFGLCLGLYAAMATSRLARILAVPGFLMELPW